MYAIAVFQPPQLLKRLALFHWRLRQAYQLFEHSGAECVYAHMLEVWITVNPLCGLHTTLVGQRLTAEVQCAPTQVAHHLHIVGRKQLFGAAYGCLQRGDLHLVVGKAFYQGTQLFLLNKGFIPLHIDGHITFLSFLPQSAYHFAAAVCAAPVGAGGHHGTATKAFHGLGDAFVVGSHHGTSQLGQCGYVLPYPLHHRLATQQSQRLTRETGRGITRRNNGYSLQHTTRIKS